MKKLPSRTREGAHCAGEIKEEKKMAVFVRGMQVTTLYGDGVVVNLPVNNRIAVRYADGTIRYFWPEDVVSGRIRPAV